jgi:hypothetical protein
MSKKISVPQLRIKKQKEDLIDQLKKNPVIQIACEKLDIGRATHYRWYTDDKEYAQAVDTAINEGVSFVAEFAESQLFNAVRNNEPWAIGMVLKAMHPRYKNKIELTGNIVHALRELTAEDEELIKESLRLALPTNKEQNDEPKPE